MSAVSIYSESMGDGPSLVLAHGFGGSARNFRPQARALAARFRVTLVDLPGHARSAAPDDPALYTLVALRQAFAEVAFRFGDAPVVGGLSLGAAVALELALAEPRRVRALVLASYPSSGEEPARHAWATGFADAIEANGLDAAGAEFAWGTRSRFDPKGAELIRQGFLEHPPEGLVHILRQTLADLPSVATLAPRLHGLDVPTLVIAGEQDGDSLPPCRALTEALPRAELCVIERAGHVVNLAQPAAFNAALDAFLSRLA
ncbi:MAG TPA: alpha/beta fold hydrolase [Polyangiaceae bacterium]|jgi:pimeloyl-ACP methyl ester carboxylesterase